MSGFPHTVPNDSVQFCEDEGTRNVLTTTTRPELPAEDSRWRASPGPAPPQWPGAAGRAPQPGGGHHTPPRPVQAQLALDEQHCPCDAPSTARASTRLGTLPVTSEQRPLHAPPAAPGMAGRGTRGRLVAALPAGCTRPLPRRDLGTGSHKEGEGPSARPFVMVGVCDSAARKKSQKLKSSNVEYLYILCY